MRPEESREPHGAGAPETSHRAREGDRAYHAVAHETAATQATAPVDPSLSTRHITTDDLHTFVRSLRSSDEGECTACVNALIARGITAETIYLDLLDHAALQFGEMWNDDSCDFVDVTVALGRLQRILRDLSHKFLADRAAPDSIGRVLLSSIPGEHHTLGLFMVAEFFIREGWDVRLGAPLTSAELGSLLRETRFDVVGFSVASSERLSHVKRTIRQLRRDSQNRALAVMVGGPVFRERPALAAHVGADGTAPDARTAPALARRLITQGDPC